MELPITTLYISFMALFIVFLSWRVIQLRQARRIGIGTGEHKDLEVAIRCHANAVEFVPITLLLLLVAELNKIPGLWLHLLATLLVVSRIIHFMGMTKTQGKYSFGRFYGILGNWFVIFALTGLNLSLYFGVQF